jgi:hypothetical protein
LEHERKWKTAEKAVMLQNIANALQGGHANAIQEGHASAIQSSQPQPPPPLLSFQGGDEDIDDTRGSDDDGYGGIDGTEQKYSVGVGTAAAAAAAAGGGGGGVLDSFLAAADGEDDDSDEREGGGGQEMVAVTDVVKFSNAPLPLPASSLWEEEDDEDDGDDHGGNGCNEDGDDELNGSADQYGLDNDDDGDEEGSVLPLSVGGASVMKEQARRAKERSWTPKAKVSREKKVQVD